MNSAVTAGAKHDEVGDHRDPSLFGLGQRYAVMGLDNLDAVDLERLDATGLTEELATVGLGEGCLGVTG